MIGRIIGSLCGSYRVETDGVVYDTKPRGLFRHHAIKPVVGDLVEFDPQTATIDKILPAHNRLGRPSVHNIDRVWVVMSIAEPEFSSLLLDKYLTYLRAHDLPVGLILSKSDLDYQAELSTWVEVYRGFGIPVHVISLTKDETKAPLMAALRSGVHLFVGQSGVGKSSLLNWLVPDYKRKIGEYSVALGRGKHQTKEVVLLPFADGYLGDTPGFSSLDLDLDRTEITQSFPGLEPYIGRCYFADCTHLHEKKCALKEALEAGTYPAGSYRNYQILFQECETTKKRRS